MKYLICIILCLTFFGCTDIVHYNDGECVVYEAVHRGNHKKMRYAYKITPAKNDSRNALGFWIYTNKQFKLGDIIEISVKKK